MIRFWNFFWDIPEIQNHIFCLFFCIIFFVFLCTMLFMVMSGSVDVYDTDDQWDGCIDKIWYAPGSYLYVYKNGFRIKRAGTFVSHLLTGITDIQCVNGTDGRVLYLSTDGHDECEIVHCGEMRDKEYEKIKMLILGDQNG